MVGWLLGRQTRLWRLAVALHAGTLQSGPMPRPRKEVCAPLLPPDRSLHIKSKGWRTSCAQRDFLGAHLGPHSTPASRHHLGAPLTA